MGDFKKWEDPSNRGGGADTLYELWNGLYGNGLEGQDEEN